MNFDAAAQSVGLLRGAFRDGVLHSISTRKDVLRAIIKMLDENEDTIVEALSKDMHRPKEENILMELLPIKLEVNHMLKNVDNWVKEQYVRVWC
ncbi:unnamed protein product [Echinostoma caproni]|uniref:CARD domain-containing protein n=1 Tax=Echinostoma caproni TaxID=27848 RepID=A0A183ASS0_9TREM|nr:unnamed protein product [Echinostoma caproni]